MGKDIDVKKTQERSRFRRQLRLLTFLLPICLYMVHRAADGNRFKLPTFGPETIIFLPVFLIFGAILLMVAMPLMNGRSPHAIVHPGQVEVGLSDVVGLDNQVDEVRRTLDTFLGYASFRDELGGTPRRGILFEGPPGTGKTYLAKAMAKEAGVPFLFIAAPQMQSMWFGMSAFRVRSYFKALRKAARKEGGAIGFIEEIDAIGGARGQMETMTEPLRNRNSSVNRAMSNGGTGMVNELLIQMQSFDQPTFGIRLRRRIASWLNSYLPPEWQIKLGKPEYSNILLIAATNRADSLDPALLRPGRFDRRLYFDRPTKSERLAIISFYANRKANVLGDEGRERLAHETLGYTPVMIEHLFDEALLLALRDGRRAATFNDFMGAKLTEELGMRQTTVYADIDRTAVATHEAGHATVAYFLGKSRRLEVLSIIKRGAALGLLAHSDSEERHTQTRSELEAAISIAFGGQVAEAIFIGDPGTGPSADLASATSIASAMVGAYGMGDSQVSFEAVQHGPFGGNLVAKVLADDKGRANVDRILNVGREAAYQTLSKNADVHAALTAALIERDELVREEIIEVIEGALALRTEVR